MITTYYDVLNQTGYICPLQVIQYMFYLKLQVLDVVKNFSKVDVMGLLTCHVGVCEPAEAPQENVLLTISS